MHLSFKVITVVVNLFLANAKLNNVEIGLRTLEYQQNDLELLSAKIQQQSEEIRILTEKKIEINQIESQITAVEDKLEAVARLMNNSLGAVAFAAELTHTVNLQNTIVPFGRSITNVGIGYSTSSYTFTAALRGLYYFSWTTLSEFKVGKYPCTYLALDGNPVYGLSSFSYGNNASNGISQTAVLVLNEGQEVNVRVGQSSICQAFYSPKNYQRISSFKGFLIRSLE